MAHVLTINSGEVDTTWRLSKYSTRKVKEGEWLSEAALWIVSCSSTNEGIETKLWRHQGRATAVHACDIYELDAKMFHAVAKERSDAFDKLKRYASIFAKNALSIIEDLDDLACRDEVDEWVQTAFDVSFIQAEGPSENSLAKLKRRFIFTRSGTPVKTGSQSTAPMRSPADINSIVSPLSLSVPANNVAEPNVVEI